MPHPAPEILLVDDQLAVRRGTELLLREAGYRVAGAAATASEAAALLRRRRHDLALVESVLESHFTAPLLAALLAERPDAPVVIYAGRDDEALAAAARIGAPGLVLKASSPATLFAALSTVLGGERFIDPDLPARLPERRARPSRVGSEMLSPREREILLLLADGFSGAEIAGRLFLSAETVRTHVRNAAHKLGCRTRTQAVALLVAERTVLGAGVPENWSQENERIGTDPALG